MIAGRVLATIGAFTLAAGMAWAQDNYPDRTITLIVPQTPGGATDTVSRILAEAMAKELGQEIVVENRPGAGNTIGTQLVLESDPDGYTLGVGSQSSLPIAPLTRPGLPYDPINDVVAVYNFANIPNALLSCKELGFETMDDLIAYANENPGKLNFASGGVGTTSHFATAMFNAYAGIADKVVHIPYQGGGQAAGGLASCESHYIVGPFASSAMYGQIEAGKLTPLAVSGDKRIDKLGDTPTFAEAGMPQYDNVGWYGMIAPKGTAPEIVAKLNAAGNAAADTAPVMEAFGNMGIDPVKVTPEAFATQIKNNVESFKKLVDDGAVVIEN
jgi:tripartite-type tricarboxylate transporter receptor subunit TctC